MKGSLAVIWAIGRKDLLLEIRNKDIVIAVAGFALLVLVIFTFAIDLNQTNAKLVGPGVLGDAGNKPAHHARVQRSRHAVRSDVGASAGKGSYVAAAIPAGSHTAAHGGSRIDQSHGERPKLVRHVAVAPARSCVRRSVHRGVGVHISAHS